MPSHNVWRVALLAALVFILAGLACDPILWPVVTGGGGSFSPCEPLCLRVLWWLQVCSRCHMRLPTSAAGFTFSDGCEVELKDLPGSCRLFELQQWEALADNTQGACPCSS
jgi:hypothetical protein